MEEGGVRLHETNEGRETKQGIAGFEGANAFYFMLAVGLGMLLFRRFSEGQDANMGMAVLIASIPFIIVSLYVFGLKQGKPPSYDIELGEWLIIKLSGTGYFSPKQAEKVALPWLEEVKQPSKKEAD